MAAIHPLSPWGEGEGGGTMENGKINGIFITFWSKKATQEVTIMPQNIIKDKDLYKIFHEIIY